MSTETTSPAVAPWLTTKEAAVIMGKDPSTVWRWTQDGSIPERMLLRRGARTYISRKFIEGEKI